MDEKTKKSLGNPDQWYEDAISQYKGSSFYDTLKTNPYLVGNNAEFSPTLLQSLGELFGDSSARDRYYADLRSKANEWYSQQIEAMRQQDYNSAPSQVNQMRVAGLNPDLQDVQPGSAAENDQPIGNGPQMSSEDSISAFANLTLQAYSFASGFAKDMLSFKSLSSEIEGKDIENGNKILPLVEDFFRSSISRPYKDESGSWVFPDLSYDKLDSFASRAFNSRLSRNRFKASVSNAWSSAKHRFIQYGALKDEEQAITAMSDALGVNLSRGWTGNDVSEHDPIIFVSKELADLRLKVEKMSLEDKYSSDSFHKNVTDRLDPSLAADAQNKGNELSVAASESGLKRKKVDDIVNDTLLSIISGLQSEARQPGLDGLLSKGLLMFYSMFGLNVSVPGLSFGTR